MICRTFSVKMKTKIGKSYLLDHETQIEERRAEVPDSECREKFVDQGLLRASIRDVQFLNEVSFALPSNSHSQKLLALKILFQIILQKK